MARLAAVEKGEYYPTPPSVVERVAQVLSPASGERGVIRLLDPCCGEGLALEALGLRLAQRSGKAVQTWGVEISPERAKEAAAKLDLVIPAPFEAVSWSPARHGVASVLFLNSPYDHNDRGGRMELDFIKASLGALVSGGVLVYIIPTTAVDYSLGEFLFRHFQDVRVFRFGDADGEGGFDRFKQIVILATRRKQSLKTLYEDQEAQGASYAFVETYSQTYAYRHDRPLKERIPVTLPEDTVYAVPAARKAANLRRTRYADGEIEGLVADGWPKVEGQIAEVMLASDAEIARPLKPPKTGHIAQIVAAGLAGVIETGGSVFKGRVVKVTEVTPDPEDESKEIARERYETNVVSVSPEGLSHLVSPSEVESFLQRHVDVFKQYIAEHFKPYGDTVTPAEERVLDTLSLDRQLLGVAKRGLLPRQREDAVALTRAIKRYGVGHLVAEMGAGKTRMALAATELMNAYPALVICPPHIVDKWVREARGAVPGAEAHVVESIAELEDLRSRYTPGQKLIAVISRSKIKLGPGWQRVSAERYTLSRDEDDRKRFAAAAQAYRTAREKLLQAKNQGANPDTIDALRREAAEARRAALERALPVPVCPGCGKRLSRTARTTRKPALCAEQVEVWDHEEGEMDARGCCAPLFQFGGRYRRWPLADYVRKKMRGFFGVLVADECFPGDTPVSTPDGPIPIKDIKDGDTVLSYKAGAVVARRVVRTIVRPRRRQLVRVTHSRGHITCTPNHKIYVDGQFVQAEHLAQGDVLTVLPGDTILGEDSVLSVEPVDSDDELVYNLGVEDTHCYFAAGVLVSNCHQFKAKDSDQGWAFGLLARHVPAVITLTGTFFGGPASSIFWLLHRTQGSVRADFGFSEETRWVSRFGVLEHVFKVDEDEYGAFSGKRWRRVSTKEKPGISPGIVRYTLPTTIFASIKDLGVALPSFQEEFVTFLLTRAMQADLKTVERFTWDQLKEWWPHYTSAWLQWNLARPNSCFRREVIEGYQQDDALDCPPVVEEGELLPKEEWLVSTVKAELAAGRKVVVYVRQTGTRDIRSRLVQVLGQGGVGGVVVLNPSVPPRKREAWLKRQNAGVLITNPKLVETGLDLVEYATVVFYEVEYSLYTLWQACRRVWRLGQTRPVKAYYLAYEDTLEDKAYSLIGAKIKASQLVYGDDVAGALVEDAGDASLVIALVEAIKEGEDLRLDAGTHIFADTRDVVTQSVMGSPVLRSPSVFEAWLAARGLTYEEVRPRRQCRTDVPKAQMRLDLFAT
jgi:hypothetical protein